MTSYDRWLEQPYQDEAETQQLHDSACDLCYPDADEWHPALITEYTKYFEDQFNSNPTELPDTFDAWLDEQHPRDVAIWVTESYFKQ
jgi:hypothetical protein